MASETIHTVTGPVSVDALGRTLMHEHLLVGMPGWEFDIENALDFREMVAVCCDRVAEMKDHGVTTFMDPCASDMGRDARLMAEVASRTGLNIICATGLFSQRLGNSVYWQRKIDRYGKEAVAPLIADYFTKEITEGIESTGVKAGIIKVATDVGAITLFEQTVLEAAAMASLATGAPITTHTQAGQLGDQQQHVLTSAGVAPNRIIIGHCCGSRDRSYHLHLCKNGSYVGFDQFGIHDPDDPKDDARIDDIIALFRAGAGANIVVSNDHPFCWRGRPLPAPAVDAVLAKTWNPLRVTGYVLPKLRSLGLTDQEVDSLLIDNPRRFFSGAPLPSI